MTFAKQYTAKPLKKARDSGSNARIKNKKRGGGARGEGLETPEKRHKAGVPV